LWKCAWKCHICESVFESWNIFPTRSCFHALALVASPRLKLQHKTPYDF
jgi:hypothetical protein